MLIGKCILVRALERDNSIVIEVSDNGPGIPEGIKDRLFQERATYGKRHGTGLGLHQVKTELAVFGGDIEVKSVEKGAAFSIILPKSLKRAKFEVTENVLALEDGEEIFRTLYHQNLQGLNIVRCKTTKEALSTLKEGDAASWSWTVLMDLNLNSDEDTSFDFLSMINTQTHIRIAIFTMLEEHADVQKLTEALGVLLLSKDRLHFIDFAKMR